MRWGNISVSVDMVAICGYSPALDSEDYSDYISRAWTPLELFDIESQGYSYSKSFFGISCRWGRSSKLKTREIVNSFSSLYDGAVKYEFESTGEKNITNWRIEFNPNNVNINVVSSWFALVYPSDLVFSGWPMYITRLDIAFDVFRELDLKFFGHNILRAGSSFFMYDTVETLNLGRQASDRVQFTIYNKARERVAKRVQHDPRTGWKNGEEWYRIEGKDRRKVDFVDVYLPGFEKPFIDVFDGLYYYDIPEKVSGDLYWLILACRESGREKLDTLLDNLSTKTKNRYKEKLGSTFSQTFFTELYHAQYNLMIDSLRKSLNPLIQYTHLNNKKDQGISNG